MAILVNYKCKSFIKLTPAVRLISRLSMIVQLNGVLNRTTAQVHFTVNEGGWCQPPQVKTFECRGPLNALIKPSGSLLLDL